MTKGKKSKITKAKSKPPKEKKAKPVMGSWPLGYIVHSLGGIGMSLRSDLSRKEARTRTSRKTGKVTHYTDWRGNGLLFRKTGSTDLTEMARVLEEAGYIEPGLVKRDYLEATSQVQDIIKAEINNPGSTEPTYSEDFDEMMQRQADARADAERDDALIKSFSVDDMEEAGGGEYDAEQQAVFAQLAEEAEALGIDVDNLREQFYDESNPEWSQKEYDQALTEALKQAIARVAGQAQGDDASGARDGGQSGVEADPVAPGAGSDRADGPDQAVQAEGLNGDLVGRTKYPDGRSVPVEGDDVYTLASGFGGMAAGIQGEVRRGKNGLFVAITGSGGMLGERTTQKRAELTRDWTLKGEDHPRNIQSRESAAKLKADTARRHAEREAELSEAATRNGTLDPTKVKLGDVLEMPDGSLVVAAETDDKGGIYARPMDDDSPRGIGNDMRGIKTRRDVKLPADGTQTIREDGIKKALFADGWQEVHWNEGAERYDRVTPALALHAESEADAQAKAKREADALAAEQKAKADEQARLKREANKREADARAAEILAEREAAKKAEVDAAADDFALGQEPPKPVDKKVAAKDLAGQKDIFGGATPFADPLTLTERQLNSLRGKPITMKAQTEDGQVASWEIDAAEAVQSLRSREATIQQLVRCLS